MTPHRLADCFICDLPDIHPDEQDRIDRASAVAREDSRKVRRQRAIKLFCIVTAVLSFGYIVGREIWAVLS